VSGKRGDKATGKGKDGKAPTPGIGNARARREYEVIETIEAGVTLTGPEVKSLREGNASLAEAYARFKGAELWLLGMHIGEYANRGSATQEAVRPRKLLLHKRELLKLSQAVQRKGLTIVPLKLYWNARSLVKLELGLARGRRLHDKRAHEKERSAKRDMDRARRRGD
jgi:SsrA-binding protein